MATSDDLMGLGLPAQLANLLGGNPNVLNGTGTTQTGAAVIKSANTEVNPQAGQTAYTFPSTARVMELYYITNAQSTTALIYVPAGHTLNSVTSGGANGHVSLAQGTSVIMWQYKPKNWAVNLSAVA